MSRLAAASREALDAGGMLADRLDGFSPREAQLRLTEAIADAFDSREVLLAEAGTGTGKTFAYLVPTLLSGLKTIVSTGTRALQDQLYNRDLPRVREALGVGHKSALLKGRANYLCKYRLQMAKGEPRFTAKEQIAQFQRIVAWSGRTKFGDVAELENLADDSPLLPMVTSTIDNCLGSECPFFDECFVVQARQRAQTADVVVVNHHLLLADLALKQEGFGEILPGAQAFVIDEAHQLPELAANFFGEGFGMRQLQELLRDCLAECKDTTGALAALQPSVREAENALRKLREAMEGLPLKGTRGKALEKVEIEDAFDEALAALKTLGEALAQLGAPTPGFESCAARNGDTIAKLGNWLAGEGDDVFWYELSPRGFRCQRTPLDVSGPLRAHREQSKAAWIFTSATLAVNGNFIHVSKRLGLFEPETLLQPSPFDWPRQALCYLPQNLPDPNHVGFARALIDTLLPVLRASNGRAFVLFASHRALREAADALKDAPWPLFVQGQMPKAALLEKFRASGNGVLLGTASFREGVDVVGDALSVVVIDKLPFAAPDDPVFEARLEAVRRSGGNPFRDEQLPQAVIALKQGVGRLIRSETDRGVLVLCDPRLTNKPYGKIFLDSLPPFSRTTNLNDVLKFFGSDEVVEAPKPAAQTNDDDWFAAARF